MDNLRTVPSNIEAEACILGSMILDSRSIAAITPIVSGVDFFRPAHQIIFENIVSMAGDAIDLVTVRDRLDNASQLGSVGGIEYLVALAEGVPSAANAEHYSRIVRKASVAREAISNCTTLCNSLYTSGEVEASIETCMRQLYDSAHRLSDSNTLREKNISDAAKEAYEWIVERSLNPGVAGIETGIEALDRITHGWQNGHLIVIGADTAGGKSTLAICQAAYAAAHGSYGIYVSAEMTAVELTKRVLQARAGIWGDRLLTGDLERSHLDALKHASDNLANDKLWFIPKSCSIAELKMAISDRRTIWGRCDFIVIDYLQIMKVSGPHGRREGVVDYIQGLKELAGEYNIPVVVLSQFNRSNDDKFKPPEIKHFKEASDIENGANCAVLLWRDPAQQRQQDPFGVGARENYQPIQARVAKNRDGQETHWPSDYNDGIELKWYPWLTDMIDGQHK